ncbi:30S ribosomal protein S18 [bacterium]|nr:30S ribosomal protein S18 [bacterium]MCK5598473.1 30S ribosomal protein S18 [bacterium]
MLKKRKRCVFCSKGVKEIDYKDVDNLRNFVTEKGRILPRRITGACSFHQRKLTVAIKRARQMALLPFDSTAHLRRMKK